MDIISSTRTLLRHTVRAWPVQMKLEILRAICEDDPRFVQQNGRKLISLLSKPLNINGIRTTGEYGEIVSSPDDRIVFAGYSEQGRWAEYSNALFGRFFDESGGGTYLDIGANIGLTTIPIAKRQTVQCLAFEPDETNFHNLCFNITQNCPGSNVKLHKVAIFERMTELSFSIAQGNLGDHRIHIGKGGDDQLSEHRRKVTKVRAVPLDDFHKDVRGPLAIKIDTQGAEPFVFAGGRNAIQEAELVVLEWWPYSMDRMSGDPLLVLNALRQGFSWGRISQPEAVDADGHPQPMSDICDQLQATLASDRQSSSVSFDITASKTERVLRPA